RRTLDRAGNLIEESAGKISPSRFAYSEEAILAKIAGALISGRTVYRYEPGCFVPGKETRLGNETMAFSPQPQTDPASWNVNDQGWRQWPTEADAERREDLSAEKGSLLYQSSRLHSPHWIKHNPYLPGITNVWVEWSGAELNDSGDTLFESETIFNAAGEPS